LKEEKKVEYMLYDLLNVSNTNKKKVERIMAIWND
jgi:hypothetical protein